MLAEIDVAVGVAELDADAVPGRSDRCLDRAAVEGGAFEREADMELGTVRAAVAGREVTIDAVVDPVMLDSHVDRLGNLDRAILLDLDIAQVAKDALIGARRSRRQHKQQGGRAAPGLPHLRPPGGRRRLSVRFGSPDRRPDRKAPR